MRPRDASDGQPAAAAPHEPLLLELRQQAAEWGVKEKQLRLWVQRRHVPFVKIGGRVMFVRTAMQKFLEDSQIGVRE